MVGAVIRSFQSFASAIRAIGATLDVIALALTALAIIIVSRLILGLSAWAAQAYAVAVANAAMTLSAGAARVAIAGLSRVMALLGGPIGVAALAAFAIYEFASANSRAGRELPAITEAIDRYRESLQNLNNAALAGQEGLNVQRLREGLEAVNDIRREIDEVTSRIDRQQGAGAFRALQFVDDRERLDDLRIELNDAVDIVAQLEGRLTAVRVARNQAIGDPQERPDTPTPILGLSEDQLNDLENLRGALDPIGDAQAELVRSTELLNTAFQVGEITLRQRDFLLNQLTSSLRDQINPLDAILRQLDEERSLLHLSGVERQTQQRLLDVELQLRQSGIQLSGEELADLRERIRLNAELSDLDRRIAEQERARLNSQREQNALAVQNARAVEEVRKELVTLGIVGADVGLEARLWADRIREQIDATTVSGQEALRQLDAIIARQEALAAGGILDGLSIGLDRYANGIASVAQGIEEVVQGSFRSMEDALVDFVRTGELSFASLVNTILGELARIAIQQTLLGPLSQLLGGALGGAFGGAGAASAGIPSGTLVAASGGYVRGPGGPRSDSIAARLSNGEYIVNASATRRFRPLLDNINSTPRFQDGGAVGSSSRGSGVTVNIIDQRSGDDQPVQVTRRGGPDGKEEIIVLITDAVEGGIRAGRFDGALGSRFGQTPRLR